jgi:hypothetical protein
MQGETVWLLPRQPGSPDAHGNPAYTWPGHTDTKAVKVDGVAVSPRSAAGTQLAADIEETNREGVIIGLMVYLPPGTRVEPVDRMYVRGHTYDVTGEPGVWINPWSKVERGVQVALSRTEG